MEQSKIIEFLKQKQDFLYAEKECSDELIGALMNVPDDMLPMLNKFPFRKPSNSRLISFFVGSLGVDRLYFGEIKKAILKYFTFGGLGVWWIADIVSAKKRCREYNCKKLIAALEQDSIKETIEETIKNQEKTKEDIKKAIFVGTLVTGALKDGYKNIQDSMEVH